MAIRLPISWRRLFRTEKVLIPSRPLIQCRYLPTCSHSLSVSHPERGLSGGAGVSSLSFPLTIVWSISGSSDTLNGPIWLYHAQKEIGWSPYCEPPSDSFPTLANAIGLNVEDTMVADTPSVQSPNPILVIKLHLHLETLASSFTPPSVANEISSLHPFRCIYVILFVGCNMC